MVAKRVRGKPLQKRWSGKGLPPVTQAPPQRGVPALERGHPFFFNMNPGILSGPSCNHDVGILAKLPVLSEDVVSMLAAKSEISDDGDKINTVPILESERALASPPCGSGGTLCTSVVEAAAQRVERCEDELHVAVDESLAKWGTSGGEGVCLAPVVEGERSCASHACGAEERPPFRLSPGDAEDMVWASTIDVAVQSAEQARDRTNTVPILEGERSLASPPCGSEGLWRTSVIDTAAQRAQRCEDELNAAVDESLDAIITEIINSEYYTSDYVTKDQPHAANLLHSA